LLLIVDPALSRPGRFDRQVVVDSPDKSGREAILNVHARNVKLADDVDLPTIAGRNPGFAGADLANLVNEAAMLAARQNRRF
jgi:cell division protease FtsH